MYVKKMLAIMLTLVLVLGLSTSALATIKILPGQAAVVRTQASAEFAGKTVILHSNDVHGAIDGYAYMAALRKDYEAKGAEVIVVDAGDFSQGSTYVSTSKGHSAIEMMNAAGYDVVTLGNHEFDYGYETLMENLADAEFTAICADVYDDKTHETILPASTIVETEAGLKIGFFGMETPETATKVNPGLITDISFATFDDLYASAQLAIDGLADADLVIGLVHLGVDDESKVNGYRSCDLLDKVTGVDFLIDGHSHTVMTAGEEGEPIQSTGTQFEYIGVIVIDNETRKIEDNYLRATSTLDKDAEVEEAAKVITDAVDEVYDTVFATTDVRLNGDRDPGVRTQETNLGDLIVDAMVWSVVKEGGIEQVEPNAVVGVTNGGGIRVPIEIGDITKNDILTVLPFGNTVAVVYATGSELVEMLEASTFSAPKAVGGYPQTSGIEWTLNTGVPFDQGEIYTIGGKETTYYAPASIQRVTITAINGEPFDPEAIYAVVTNNFCAAGGDTYNVLNRAYSEGAGFDTGIPMDQAVIDYITEVLDGKITSEAYGENGGRETRIDEAPTETDAAA
ncbi:MAG: 5'-nucleotidase C-terminal domain-containing protein [Clostridia bacterium]|nr:5'-nucleotidase C-terminal domain-containing protein [Clostridia bacterium]